MDEALVDEILKRVLEAMKDSQEPLNADEKDNKEKILILSPEHQEGCHEILENPELLKYYQMECALTKNYDLDLNEYQAVILCNLTNTLLGKLCGGIFDSPFLNLASQAILTGKKIYIPKQEVEIYQYKDSAPEAYYKMMLDKISFLQESGISFVDHDQLLNILEQRDADAKKITEQVNPAKAKVTSEKPVVIDKKIITEKDIERAYENGAVFICISKKSILSDLAKEYARKRNIEIQRSECCSGNAGLSL